MTLKRLDHVSVVVDDLAAALELTRFRSPQLIALEPAIAPPNTLGLSWDASDRASGQSYAAELRAHIASEAFLAGLSRNSQFVVAPASFHEVHLYQPEIVTNAILQVLVSARTGERLARPH